MPVLSIQLRRAHKQQKRTALEMLTLSGIVRPSHVEPRYATRIARITAFRTQPTVIESTQPRSIPTGPWKFDLTSNLKQAWLWMWPLSSIFVQLKKKPIAHQWTKQVDV
jgi:hypothetical protein